MAIQMNKRKKATLEVKRSKIIKNLSTIIEKEKLDQLQKKSLVYEIEIYKQNNENLYDQNEKLKHENIIFYSIILYLLKNEEDSFFIKDETQSIFYRRVLDCIVRFKTTKQKKNKKVDVEISELSPQNIDTLEKIINEFENCILAQLRENLNEKDELIYSFQKKILDLQSELKKAQQISNEHIDSVDINSSTSNIALDKIPNLIKSLDQERILELNKQLEENKFKIVEHENLVKEHELLLQKIQANEQVDKNIDLQLRSLIEENTKFTNTMKTRLKLIEDKKQVQINELQSKLEGLKEINFVLKTEIVELQKNDPLTVRTSIGKASSDYKSSQVEISHFEKPQAYVVQSDAPQTDVVQTNISRTNVYNSGTCQPGTSHSDVSNSVISQPDSCRSVVSQEDASNSDAQEIESIKRQMFVLKHNKDILDFEKKEIFAEKERYKTEKKKNTELEAKLNSEIFNLKSEVQNRINAAAYHKKNFIKIDNEAKYLKNKLKNINVDELPLKKELENLKQRILTISNENKLLSDDLENYKAVFKQLMGSTSPELIDSIEKYRKLLRCPTCDKNYKDTVINKCMHVLCKECVDNRLKMRSRKCPICAESFSSSDVKRIFL